MSCSPTAAKIFIPEELANKRIKKFQRQKHNFLSKKIGKIESLYSSYTLSQFLEILRLMKSISPSGFRIYIATFLGHGTHFPASSEHLLTLIFAPTKLRDDTGDLYGIPDEHDDTGNYYIIDIDGKILDVKSMSIKEDWVKAYEDNQYKYLTDELHIINETKSMWYDLQSLDALISEINCWRREGNPVNEIQIFLACYLKEDKPYTNPYDGKPIDLNNKLTLIFYYINENEESEKKASNTRFEFSQFSRLADYDTGSPCPPAKCPR